MFCAEDMKKLKILYGDRLWLKGCFYTLFDFFILVFNRVLCDASLKPIKKFQFLRFLDDTQFL